MRTRRDRAARLDPGGHGRPLLLEWLRLAGDRGVVVPARLLPDLLETARTTRDDAVRAAAAQVVGERGRWLAGRNPAWAPVLAAAEPSVRLDELDDDPVWTHGTAAQRVAWLVALRRVDPAAARDRLRPTWGQAKADERADLLGAFLVGLGADDEPFLDAALEDRAAAVRTRAAEVLAVLPTSRFAGECARRALACLGVERRLLRDRLVVTLPEPDNDARSPFGVPRPGTGAGSHLLAELVAHSPLAAWSGLREPATLVRLAGDAPAPELLDGWERAALRERDARWAAALVVAPDGERRAVGLAPVLAHADLVAVVRRALAGASSPESRALGTVAALLDAVPTPWSADLTATVLAWLCSPAAPSALWLAPRVAEQVGLALEPTVEAERAVRAAKPVGPAATPRAETERAVRAAAANVEQVEAALGRAADLLHVRRQITEELR